MLLFVIHDTLGGYLDATRRPVPTLPIERNDAVCTSCSCSADDQVSDTNRAATNADPRTGSHVGEYKVAGMTCGHCVSSVTKAIQQIPGVQGVEVDLATEGVSIRSEQPLPEATVRAAVTAAGFTMA